MLRLKTLAVVACTLLLAAACSSGSSHQRTIGGVKANFHGTKAVTAGSTVEIEADDYYFEPSVLTGQPGQQVTLHIKNATSSVEHNFTLQAQHINDDIKAGKDVTVKVTFPSSGVLSFWCEYHKDRGMAGGLQATG
jgi:plastocyanin